MQIPFAYLQRMVRSVRTKDVFVMVFAYVSPKNYVFKYKVVQIWPGLTGNYGLKIWFKIGLKLV
jgi:hypothetical protein